MHNPNHVLGIDVGGTGIKGAIIDIESGELLTERLRVPTPQPADPKAVTEAFLELYNMFDYHGDCIGVGFPAIVANGVALSAANIHPDWINVSISKLWTEATGKKVYAVNDADAAGLASVRYGSAKELEGLVLFLTIGTGIGSGMFINNTLIPNTEFGHIYMPNGMKSEHYASNAVRKSLELSWEDWGTRFNEVLQQLDRILSPDFILLGGGISKSFELYEQYLDVHCPIEPAQLLNEAGSIGAAIYAFDMRSKNA